MACEHHVHEEEDATVSATESTSAQINYAWIRRQLSDSIYVWACGEKADSDDEVPKLSERLIGWLILFMQGFAYAMLIFLARATSASDAGKSADDSIASSYLLPSVIGAMYLLVASTTHDLRAGFLLLVDRDGAGNRAFGVGLLIVYGIMISAAMKVLVSTSDDTASVVLNAVTVLFVSDLDEKTLKFLLTVPKRWRLFWAIQSIGISFTLALVAVAYMADATPLLGANKEYMKDNIPNWGFWLVIPAAVTWCSYRLSSALQAACEFIEAGESSTTLSCGFVVSKSLKGLRALFKGTIECLRAEPWFYAFFASWIAQGVGSWLVTSGVVGPPVAFTFAPNTSAGDEYSIVIADDIYALVTINAVLAAGLSMKMLAVATGISKQRITSAGDGSEAIWDNSADSRVPSLLVGWGIGYWVTSLLFLSAMSWHGNGWTNAPIFVTIFSYVGLPLFLISSVFMVADLNFLGETVGGFVEPAVGILKNRRLVMYWVLATVLRDVVNLWILFCMFLKQAPPA